MSATPRIDVYPDPLTGGKQAMIATQLICAVCGKDLSGPRCPGIIDLASGKAYCCADHWTLKR